MMMNLRSISRRVASLLTNGGICLELTNHSVVRKPRILTFALNFDSVRPPSLEAGLTS